MENSDGAKHRSYFSEAVFISLLSAISYFVAFRYEQSYLRYFGAPELFVDLSLERVVSVFSYIIASVAALYPIINSLAIFRHPKILYAILCVPIELFLLVIALIAYWLGGVTWFVIVPVGLVILLILNHIRGVARTVLRGQTWKEWFELYRLKPDGGDKEPDGREKTLKDVDDLIIEKFGRATYVIIFMLVLVVPIASSTLGDMAARQQKLFKVYAINDSEFVLVGQKGDSWILSEIRNSKVTGKNVILRIDPAKPVLLNDKIYPLGIRKLGEDTFKPTFADWWSSVWKQKMFEPSGIVLFF